MNDTQTWRVARLDDIGRRSTVDLRDNHAPTKPEGVALEGGEGWRGVNDFTARWTNPPGQIAPIARSTR